MIRFLLASGATECINARDEDGSTPLIHAAFANRPGNVAVRVGGVKLTRKMHAAAGGGGVTGSLGRKRWRREMQHGCE